jgi:large subunit ribosomal protein L3|uniref:Large ribosomal subunit protein uL3 n=1 Tax=Dictyoglomus turgidum TaxID=513050 RepID=A0A7C3WV29_9BACT
MAAPTTKAILGRKVGMTQIFGENGEIIPVTVIKSGPCLVLNVKTKEKDGYNAIQLGFERCKESKLNKPLLGIFKKLGFPPFKIIKEVRVVNASDFAPGQELKVDVFQEGELVDITGKSKGHGFTGHIKLWNFARGRMSHGSKFHRRRASIGAGGVQHVMKGQKMAGRWGNETITVQNLKIVKVDKDKDLILVKGAVPGPVGNLLIIRKAVKDIK